MDFAVLPPEVNSGRMYAGAGAGPLLAGAAAWDSLASELSAAASSYQSVITDLTGGGWLGPSATAMAAAAAPYVAWMNTTAGQAEQTATQAKAAAAAYQTAFAGVVPPPVITANRTLLASLVATNILGQNTPAIAATETQYAEMWAQDAVAMYGYAGAASAATQLTPFDEAPQTTNPSGTAAQGGAVSQANGTGGLGQTLSQVPNALQSLASPAQASPGATGNPIYDDLLNLLTTGPIGDFVNDSNLAFGYFGAFNGGMYAISGAGFVVSPFISASMVQGALIAQAAINAPAAAAAAATASDVSGGALGAGLASTSVSAGVGEAATVGGLSVPPTWGSAPAIRLASAEMPLAGGLGAVPEAALAAPGSFGAPVMGPIGSVVNAPRNGEGRLRSPSRAKVIPAIAAAPGAHEDTPDQTGTQDNSEHDSGVALSGRAELRRLRRLRAELAKERDVLQRSANMLIKEALHK
ncbi:PPE family protein [Mycobacterium paraterrae]